MKKLIILALFMYNGFAETCLGNEPIVVKSLSNLSNNSLNKFIITDGKFKGYKIITNLSLDNQNRLSNDVNQFKTNNNSTQNVFLISPNGFHTEFSAKIIDGLDNKFGLHFPFYKEESATFEPYGNICTNWSTDPISN